MLVNSFNGLTYDGLHQATSAFSAQRTSYYQNLYFVSNCVTTTMVAIANVTFGIIRANAATGVAAIFGWSFYIVISTLACIPASYLITEFVLKKIPHRKIENVEKNFLKQSYFTVSFAHTVSSVDIKSGITSLSINEQEELIKKMNFRQLYAVYKTLGVKRFEKLIQGVELEDHQKWKAILASAKDTVTEFDVFSRYFSNDYFFYKAWHKHVALVQGKSKVMRNSFLDSRPRLPPKMVDIQLGNTKFMFDENTLLENCSFFKPKANRDNTLEERIQNALRSRLPPAAPEDPEVQESAEEAFQDVNAYLEFLHVCTDPNMSLNPEIALRVLPVACEFQSEPLMSWLTQFLIDKNIIIDPHCFNKYVLPTGIKKTFLKILQETYDESNPSE